MEESYYVDCADDIISLLGGSIIDGNILDLGLFHEAMVSYIRVVKEGGLDD